MYSDVPGANNAITYKTSCNLPSTSPISSAGTSTKFTAEQTRCESRTVSRVLATALLSKVCTGNVMFLLSTPTWNSRYYSVPQTCPCSGGMGADVTS